MADSSTSLALARYQVVKPLKIGGTAAIYLAVMRGENNFSREVVIKRPLPHLVADQRARLMFVDEAHIASRLNHPNICQVLDLVSRKDELYLVLEYLRGVDLREILKRCIQLGRLMPPEVATWMAVEIAGGLESAHEAGGIDGQRLGIVHRDVSPKNIRITPDGSVKIIDFGIARAENRATETAAGTIKGTLGYMSPEQILGDDIDHRSDIFAFGIVLFQMLTCRNPFDGPTLKERVRRLTVAPIPSVREFNPALDGEIEALVARCMDRDVEDRYQHMRDVQSDLDSYLAKLHVVSPKRRLISFLMEIFPSLNDDDDELKNVLTEVSSVTGRIDTEQRLRFPDDPPTETARPAEGATNATEATQGATAVTSPGDPGDMPTSAPATVTGDAAATRQVAAQGTIEQSRSDTRRVEPPFAQPSAALPWGVIGVLLTIVAGLVAALVIIWQRDQVLDPAEPIPPSAPVAKLIEAVDAGTIDVVDAGTKPTKPSAIDAGTRPKTNPKKHKPALPKTKPPKSNSPKANGGKDRAKARLFFRTGLHLSKRGRSKDARLMYTLSYAKSDRPPSTVFLNMALLANQAEDYPKAKACFNGYLARRPGAPDANQIKMMIASMPPVKSVSCFPRREITQALRRYARQGAKIDAWVDQAVKAGLK